MSNVLNHYYPDRFPTFWEKFYQMIDEKKIVSVREARLELQSRFDESMIELLEKHNANFFEAPRVEELSFITEIYSVAHFQQNLDRKKLLQGGYFADPFIIAKAKINEGFVVTEEDRPDHGARIPNICEHFGIACVKLEGFLVKEDWRF